MIYEIGLQWKQESQWKDKKIKNKKSRFLSISDTVNDGLYFLCELRTAYFVYTSIGTWYMLEKSPNHRICFVNYTGQEMVVALPEICEDVVNKFLIWISITFGEQMRRDICLGLSCTNEKPFLWHVNGIQHQDTNF